MSMVLIYNLDSAKDAKLKMLCRKMNIGSRSVDKSEYGHKLGYLIGVSDESQITDGDDFDDGMLYISGIRGGMLNLFIDQLRRNKIIVPLKAIHTPTNEGFTSYELYKELCAERDAIAKGTNAHDQK